MKTENGETDDKRRKNRYNRERYYWLKSKGICVRCGREKADRGKTMCLMCRMDELERKKEQYRTNPEVREIKKQRQKIYDHNIYAERLKNGICPTCGKRPIQENRRQCSICLAKNRQRVKKYWDKKGIMPRFLMGNGEYCYICGKPGCNGEKLCPECKERVTANLSHSIPSDDHIWRRITAAECEIVRKKKGEN